MRPRLWRELIADLGHRGRGKREAGAFLLAEPSARTTVTAWVAYDDLDPECLTGGISFSGAAFGHLAKHCTARGLVVTGDVHTHPSRWVSQSHLDRDHPMMVRKGHVALIVPNYGLQTPKPQEVGVHRYIGGRRWDSRTDHRAAGALYVGWFA